MLKVEQVAIKLNCSVYTINTWYRWKKTHADSPYAELLPEPIKGGERNTRYWHEIDIAKLKKFKKTIPHGRNGILGDTTQKHKRRQKDGKNES